MSYIREAKNKIRDTYRDKRNALTPEQKEKLDSAIIGQIKNLASFRFSQVILAYAALPDEIDVTPLILDALAMGKRVALPRCGENSSMEYYFITSLDDLEEGSFGIREPKTTLEKYDRSSDAPALMIIPALVYDKYGYRLGYGRGFYDRYVNGFKGGKAGLSYRFCIHSSPLPRGRFDFAVDFIVSEKGVTLCEKV